ncbi:hypothetical protein P168DRAFT_290576 [Aspergillus campestris IBT 28561]|uniref:Carboxymuconolactone decarboxylase-like domain-containing protein n=1 Tax=Aspergillus campestris (strain IBT 28561) TaxID=1392248 RepID=A0A2I1D3T8_ASPC2|nr:uncharacterized protein P168DRAFT_290576 [Aspergillus campestris IBT 28561]PKY04518.1 hypothetical protein P168DRAFT_290576 [Aspergillus campestris IBT 28561]
MRLPYAPQEPPSADPDTVAIYQRIAERRHPRPLIPLDLSLLHAPPVADGWNSFLGAIRTRTQVDTGLLEMAVCRVAVLNGADLAGARAALAAETALSTAQRAVVRYVDEMTQTVRVADDTFAGLQSDAGLSDREIVELTTGIAGYNCVSRVLVALDVGENNGREMKSVDELVAAL